MTEAAVLDWIRTFESVEGCSSLSSLCSGHIVGLMLSELEPGYFGDLCGINDTSDNWALSASNIKKIIRKIESYFLENQRKRVDTTGIDANIIARGQDPSHVISLLELAIGVAVLCDNKAQFIPKIFSLNQDSQVVLKSMVERVMNRLIDVEEEGAGATAADGDEDSHFLASQLKEAQDLIHAQAAELEEIKLTFQEVVSVNTTLKEENEALKEKEFQREVDTDSDRSRAEAAATVQAHMKVEIETLRAQVSEMSSDLESRRQDIQAMSQRLDENEQIRTRLEVEALQMADELDIARDKSVKLTKAEATIAKYQSKMEEMSALKQQTKEMEAQMDKYLEQIHELETASKSATSTQKMVEKYKDRSVVLERERFEAISALEMKEDDLNRVKGDLDAAQEAKRFLEEELASVSAQLEVLEAEKAAESEKGSGLGVFESPAALKEKIKQLELDLRMARRESAAKGGHGSGEGQGTGTIAAADESILQAELEDTRAAKKEREEALLSTKKELAEAQHDLRKALAALEEAERSAGSAKNSADADKVKELEQQLALKANTLKHLEGLLMESETKLNKVEHDKEKLEIFAKRSLTNFKDKYMAALQRYKSEKNALEVKLQAMMEKNEKEQERFRREERLMLSAVYELGVQTMERSINLQIHETAAAPTTFLSAQRADQERRLNPALGNAGTPTTTPMR